MVEASDNLDLPQGMFDTLWVGQDYFFHCHAFVAVRINCREHKSISSVTERLQIHVARAKVEAMDVHEGLKLLCHVDYIYRLTSSPSNLNHVARLSAVQFKPRRRNLLGNSSTTLEAATPLQATTQTLVWLSDDQLYRVVNLSSHFELGQNVNIKLHKNMSTQQFGSTRVWRLQWNGLRQGQIKKH